MDRGSQLDEDDEDDEDNEDDKEDEEDEEARRRTRRRGGGRGGEEEEEATNIKSNNPHLAGGEQAFSIYGHLNYGAFTSSHPELVEGQISQNIQKKRM